jgi:transmembrane 9 superfamily protein 2/4
MFAYCIFFFNVKLNREGTESLLSDVGSIQYLGYSAILSIAFGLANGAIGFGASLLFVRKIFSYVHIE